MTTSDLVNVLKTDTYANLEAVNADRRTWRMISLGDLKTWMHESDTSDGVPLRVALGVVVANEQTPDALRVGLQNFLDFVADPDFRNLHTHREPVASKSRAMVDALVQMGLLSSEQAAELWALGGGLRVPEPVTPEQYQAALDQIEREQQRDAALAGVDAARNQYAAALDQWVVSGGVMPEFE